MCECVKKDILTRGETQEERDVDERKHHAAMAWFTHPEQKKWKTFRLSTACFTLRIDSCESHCIWSYWSDIGVFGFHVTAFRIMEIF